MITSFKNETKINMKIRNKSVADSKPQVYGCSQRPLSQFWDDSLSAKVFHRFSVHQVDCVDLICAPEAAQRDSPFSPLFAQLLGFSFGFGPTSACKSPEGICSHPDRMGLKQWLIKGLWLTQSWGREGYGSYDWKVG